MSVPTSHLRHPLPTPSVLAHLTRPPCPQCLPSKGPGILLSEDDSLYEGTFTRDLTLVGKVRAPGTPLHTLPGP